MYASDYLSRYSFFRQALETAPLTAMHDSLTGLIARPYILRFIESLIAAGTPFAMAMVDLDNFKSINDNYGHRTGDEMLSSVAASLTRYVGESGVVGRYGGDEYVIYPILQNVLTPGDDFSGTLYHHYIHEDYHYGYPFYAVSSLFMYPIRLFCGPDEKGNR